MKYNLLFISTFCYLDFYHCLENRNWGPDLCNPSSNEYKNTLWHGKCHLRSCNNIGCNDSFWNCFRCNLQLHNCQHFALLAPVPCTWLTWLRDHSFHFDKMPIWLNFIYNLPTLVLRGKESSLVHKSCCANKLPN